jgi:DNA-directed RNA polymerase subunit RPC12/RpoP
MKTVSQERTFTVKISKELFYKCPLCGNHSSAGAFDFDQTPGQIKCQSCRKVLTLTGEGLCKTEDGRELTVPIVERFISEWNCPKCTRRYVHGSEGSIIETLYCTDGPKCERIFFQNVGGNQYRQEERPWR